MASEFPHRTPNGIVVILGSAAAFVVIAAIFAGALARRTPVNEVENKRAAQRIEAFTKLDAEANAKLSSEGWVDKAKGTVHVSIGDAMTMVVAELTAKKPAPSSVKVEAPLPMPVADPASGEPPPAALPSAPQGADTVHFAPPAAPVAAPIPAPSVPAPAIIPAAPAPVEPAAPAPAALPVPLAPIPEKPSPPAPAPAIPPTPTIPPAPAPEKLADPAIPPAPSIPPPPAPPIPPAPAPEKPADPAPPAAPANPTENPAPTK